jgi:predicted dehydrogenase
MLAENYPYTVFNQQMRRLYQDGEIGEVTYAEGEYNHPMGADSLLRLAPGRHHWRNWLPSTYYCTHALAPLVYITDTRPVRVNALSIPCAKVEDETARVSDAGSVILCRMDNGAVFRLFGLLLPGHSCWYRVHGATGAMEITRGAGYFGPQQVRVWHEGCDLPEGAADDDGGERLIDPKWPEHRELAEQAGHGGGDFWTCFHFAEAIRSGTPPFLDVYRGVAMSSVGILGWKSALEEGRPFDVPDFRVEAERLPFEDDHWSPWPEDAGPGQPPPSLRGFREPNPAGLARGQQIWREMGYQGEDI